MNLSFFFLMTLGWCVPEGSYGTCTNQNQCELSGKICGHLDTKGRFWSEPEKSIDYDPNYPPQKYCYVRRAVGQTCRQSGSIMGVCPPDTAYCPPTGTTVYCSDDRPNAGERCNSDGVCFDNLTCLLREGPGDFVTAHDATGTCYNWFTTPGTPCSYDQDICFSPNSGSEMMCWQYVCRETASQPGMPCLEDGTCQGSLQCTLDQGRSFCSYPEGIYTPEPSTMSTESEEGIGKLIGIVVASATGCALLIVGGAIVVTKVLASKKNKQDILVIEDPSMAS